MPVSSAARLGARAGEATKARANDRPADARRWSAGVRTLPSQTSGTSAYPRSSARKIQLLGSAGDLAEPCARQGPAAPKENARKRVVLGKGVSERADRVGW